MIIYILILIFTSLICYLLFKNKEGFDYFNSSLNIINPSTVKYADVFLNDKTYNLRPLQSVNVNVKKDDFIEGIIYLGDSEISSTYKVKNSNLNALYLTPDGFKDSFIDKVKFVNLDPFRDIIFVYYYPDQNQAKADQKVSYMFIKVSPGETKEAGPIYNKQTWRVIDGREEVYVIDEKQFLVEKDKFIKKIIFDGKNIKFD